jgi:hypothetical protein
MLAAGDTEGARAAFESGLAAVRDAGDLWTITLLYEGLGLAEALARDSRRAEEHLRHAIALAQRQESAYLEARCLASLGAVQLLTDPTLGTVTLHAAQARLEPLGAVREAARVDVWLACAEATRGGSSAAGCHLRAALSRTVRIGGDAVLDLPARWHPAVLLEATVAPDEAARLAAIHARLDRRVRPARPPAPHVLPTIGVRGFGHGAVTVDGKEAAWTWEKSRELFFLLLHDGPHNADQIQAILWPEVPPVRAKVSLHTAAYRLRRQIHRDIIMRRDGAYRLNVEMVLYYDIREFERLTADGGPSLDDDHIERLEQAAALYTAPFLNDLDAAWIMQERVRLEQRLALTLERLAMALQEVENVFDLEWGAGVKYRDVRHRDEVEQSRYAFGQIDMPAAELHERHRRLFEQYYELAQTLLRSGLVLPALDYCLKCSHMFNLLDASGGIGVTERTAYILRVRQLAVAIAKAWTGVSETEGAESGSGEAVKAHG